MLKIKFMGSPPISISLSVDPGVRWFAPNVSVKIILRHALLFAGQDVNSGVSLQSHVDSPTEISRIRL